MATVEVVTFSLRAGADEAAFRQADEAVQTGWAPFQPGAARRTTARGSDGTWLVLTLWADEAAARQGAEGAADDATCQQMMALVDASTVRVTRFETLD